MSEQDTLHRLRMHARLAHNDAVHPTTQRHLEAVLCLLDPELPPHLRQCEECGRLGLAERIDASACPHE